MRTQKNQHRERQIELAERVVLAGVLTVRDLPTADVELEEMFLRAASAWARWRCRTTWVRR